MEKYIAYYRVSTSEQGDSGLGIDAQKRRVAEFLKGQLPEKEYTEIESGKNDSRPMLKEAVAICKEQGTILVIAKLDRLSRNLTFISTMMDSKIRFVCADMPGADELTLQFLAVIAQAERKMISDRTKRALQSLKDKGVKLGNPNWQRDLGGEKAEAARRIAMNKKKADNPNNKRAKAHIKLMKESGMTLKAMAEALNSEGYETAMGKKFTPIQVSRLL